MNKLRFGGVFLLGFALLLPLWKASHAGRWYTAALLRSAAVLGPMVHGWVLEAPAAGAGAPAWVRGDRRVRVAVQFDALAVGLVPLWALLAATPGLGLRRRAALTAAGTVLCFFLHTLTVVLFPLLVFYKNAFTDVLGTFLGLVVFVGAPVIIWFVLAFRQLQHWLPSLRRPATLPH